MIHHAKYTHPGGEAIGRWVLTYVGTDEVMTVLLAMTTKEIAAAGLTTPTPPYVAGCRTARNT